MLSTRFPLGEFFEFGSHQLTALQVQSIMAKCLTTERLARIDQVVENRTCNLVPVLEDIYDRGNVSAVMRTAEAMGCVSVHIIELGEKFKNANRVSQGADKWLEVQRWSSSADCARRLRDQGYQILATHLDSSESLFDVDVTVPTALVFGNEKDGVSRELLAEADRNVFIPMLGFVQSFNISVAAAIALYHVTSRRLLHFGQQGDLSLEEKQILKAEYSLRSSKNPEKLILEFGSRDR